MKFLPDCDILFLIMANGEAALSLPPSKTTVDECELFISKVKQNFC